MHANWGSIFCWSSQVVGWPPIRTHRLNTLFNHAKASNVAEEKGAGADESDESSKKKINHGGDKHDAAIKERGNLGFVKVNMDGLPIGRKVDLNAHKSYQTLAKALEEMFFNPSLSTRRFSLSYNWEFEGLTTWLNKLKIVQSIKVYGGLAYIILLNV